jgi:phospholipase C
MFRNDPPDLLYDWLDKHSVGWAVYHEDTPFFKQMPRVFERFEADVGLGNQFKDLQDLRTDALNHALPQFVFVEPRYQDDPWKGAAATDDHAPASLQGGQNFLYKVYDAISADPETWAETVFIITYDEHGSFFDHVRPAKIRTDAPLGANYQAFETTGVRVPAIVVSPFVTPGYVHEGLMDHTSILKFVGEKFGAGHYSPVVDDRLVGSVSDILDDHRLDSVTPTAEPPRP